MSSNVVQWNNINIEDGRFPEWSYFHAKDVLHCKWSDIGKPEVEDIIGKNSEWAYWYAKGVLYYRWVEIGKPEVEDIIGKDPEWTNWYSYYVLHCSWSDVWVRYLKKNKGV